MIDVDPGIRLIAMAMLPFYFSGACLALYALMSLFFEDKSGKTMLTGPR